MTNKYDWLLKKTPRSVDAMKLWGENPRLNPEDDYISISDFTEEVTRLESDRKDFIDLAKSIVSKGFIPADPVVVWQGDDKKYYVAEGNRRVLALKLLRDPEKSPRSIRATMRGLSAKINNGSIDKIHVSVSPTFEDAEWYISQRNSMSSLQKRWAAEQQRRWVMTLYDKYDGNLDIIRSKIDLSEADLQRNIRLLKLKELVREIKDELTEDEFERATSINFPITTFERFFFSAKVREAWGIEFDDYEVSIISDHSSFLKAFAQVIKRMLVPKGTSGRIDSRSINGESLDEVLETLPKVEESNSTNSEITNNNQDSENNTEEESDVSSGESDPAPPPKPKDDPNRSRLIHHSYSLISDEFRLYDVFEELKELPLKYKNSAAASVRILLDLSVLNYIKANSLETEITGKYKRTLRDVTLKLRLEFIKEKLSGKPENIISKLLNPSNHFSLDVLNGYQHNADHHFIDKKHLNQFWDFLFPLFQILVDIREE